MKQDSPLNRTFHRRSNWRLLTNNKQPITSPPEAALTSGESKKLFALASLMSAPPCLKSQIGLDSDDLRSDEKTKIESTV